MSGFLRLLMLEDNPVDAELNERVLRKAGITFEAQRVETKKAFVAALEDFKPDLILADYKLPGFDGLEALAIAREKAPQTPYIFVTGAMGEERAVESIKQGATDYLLKDRLARLPEAVQRAIVEKAQRAQLREVEDHYHQLFENLSSGVMIFQPDASGEGFVIKAANRAVERIEQLRLADLIGRNVEEIFPNVRAFGLLDVLKRVWGSGETEHFPPTLYADSRITSWRECYVYRFGSNEVVAVYEDVSERLEHETQIKWLNRILRTISACNEDLVHAKCEEDLLKEVCRDIVEIGGHLLASVAYPGENPEELPRTVSHYGDETVFRLHAELDDDPDHSLRCLT
ncbi:MAG: response regulator, partial [Azonexus sp.]